MADEAGDFSKLAPGENLAEQMRAYIKSVRGIMDIMEQVLEEHVHDGDICDQGIAEILPAFAAVSESADHNGAVFTEKFLRAEMARRNRAKLN